MWTDHVLFVRRPPMDTRVIFAFGPSPVALPRMSVFAFLVGRAVLP